MPSETLDVKQSLHLAWFAGHVATLAGGTLHILSLLLFHPSNKPYYLAYLGAFISYAIVMYQSYGVPVASGAYFQQLLLDENTPYLFMAGFWLFFGPVISISVIPYVTYSTFHVISFVRSNYISTQKKELQQTLKSWTDMYYGGAMRFVSFIEVVPLTARVAMCAIWSFHWTSFFIHCFFLRYRYLSNAYTRQVFRDVDTKLDTMLPPATKPTYEAFRGALARFVDTANP
ncbi:hypothetical protein BJV82DRAFT_588549 [Fennellomyces sp. T-0311]|nr:hypothetical protein BJV82DRAFT_588549 [Fennellomyces sp. T-0311]